MKIARFLRTLSFQIALAMSVLIVAVSALIVWQVDGLIRSNEFDRFTDELEAARLRFGQQIETERQLTLIGASLLANRPDMREAIEQENVFAILRVAGEYYEQASSPLPETTGLLIYDEQGNLIVRTHTTPNTQLAVPEGVLEAIRTRQPVSAIRMDEVRGPSIAGTAPVLDDTGEVVAVIEGLIAIDQQYLETRARALRVELGLQANETVLHGTGEHPFTVEEIGNADLRRRLDDGAPVMTEGEHSHLTTVFPLEGLGGAPVAEVYLGIDEARIMESVSEVREAAFRTTAIGAAIAVVLTGGLAFVALRPIRELVGAAGRIQRNDLETPVRTRGPAEVVDLADALDDLRLAVWQSREAMLSANLDLASRMDRSTASLTEATQELAVMHGVLAALSSDAPGGLEGVVDHLAELDWVDGALIALAVEDGHLVPAASVGLTPPARTALLGLVNNDAQGERLDSGIIVEDTSGLAGGLRGHELGGFAVQPMLAAGGVSGAVAVTTRGRLRITQSRTELLRSVSREIVAMLERTELAGEVEENRRLAEAVLREMTDGVLVIDYTDQCRVANPAAARLLGRSVSQLIGSRPEEILPLSEDGMESLRRRATGRSRVPLAPLLAEVDGRSLAISAGPFVDAEAGPDHLGVLVLIHDLSSEADAERVKQDFVSMVGHELRTPLTLIRTTIDLLNEGDAGQLNETQQRIVQVLHGNSDRLMVLISDLLDMSALDSGRMQIQPTEVDIVDIVEEAVAEARPAAAAKDHHLRAELPSELVAHADRRRILQVLSNLIGNAIKYTPPGGHIEVSASARGALAEIRVQDNGIGIPPSEQKQLFEKFYRTIAGRRTTGGTGLGLAIARSLIDLHGGSIWIESDGETGSTFVFTLPTRPI